MAYIENRDTDQVHLRFLLSEHNGAGGRGRRGERREKFEDDYNLSQQLKHSAAWILRRGKKYQLEGKPEGIQQVKGCLLSGDKNDKCAGHQEQ